MRDVLLVHQPGLTASLASFDLLDLVQAIHLDHRALSLVVRNGAQSLGVLHFSQGELLWAEFQGLRGDEAFIALAAQKNGSIEQRPWDGQGERNVVQPLSRLIMQAASHRDTHNEGKSTRSPDQENWQPQSQSRGNGAGSAQPREYTHNVELQPPPAHGQPSTPNVELPDDVAVPSWVREIRATSVSISMQRTDILPPKPAADASAEVSSAMPAEGAPEDFSPAEESGASIQPTLPLSALNGKMSLPSLGNGNRASYQTPEAQQEPPTVPLPTIQGGLLDYASKREPLAQTPAPPAGPKIALRASEPPMEAIAVRSSSEPVSVASPASPASSTTAVPEMTSPQPLPPYESQAEVSSAPSVDLSPHVEAKPSSLSILEQLAYGNLSSNGEASQATGKDETVKSALEQVAPEPSADIQQLRQVLEAFIDQVGPACIATALVRTDGSLVADYTGRRAQEQELNSPAYHLAHVMQSSLRALLMGGWGDLEETMITGSTHLVVLRRLGRPEKGVFHVAVLERSGNPGLCRVRMRGSESALLQSL
jgi:predicted regulator of Ras-like GTPase activity (Roadblock/LC7/MglB family)